MTIGPTQARIIALLRTDGPLTVREIDERLGSASSYRASVARLREQGIVRRRGFVMVDGVAVARWGMSDE